MDRVSTYIRQVLQDIYPFQELKSLTMMIWCDLLGMDALDIYLGKDINLSESKQYELENILPEYWILVREVGVLPSLCLLLFRKLK